MALSVPGSVTLRRGSKSQGLTQCLQDGMEPALHASLEVLTGIPGGCEAALYKCLHHLSNQHWPWEAAQLKRLDTFAVTVFQRPHSCRAPACLLLRYCLVLALGVEKENTVWRRQEIKETFDNQGAHSRRLMAWSSVNVSAMFSVCKVNPLFLKLDSFCPITMGPKHLLWFTEVILIRSELQIAHPAEERVQHGELCCREE